jgi:hypothetical protein
MTWDEAKKSMQANLKFGQDLDTEGSDGREIVQVNKSINSRRYRYEDENGFYVSIGVNKLNIPWSMLEKCFRHLSRPAGYDGDRFREDYPRQAADHGCHVHVVGQMFVRAGIARTDGGSYRLA